MRTATAQRVLRAAASILSRHASGKPVEAYALDWATRIALNNLPRVDVRAHAHLPKE